MPPASSISTKGEDILALDLTDVSSVADYFIIASGSSEPHVHALGEAVIDGLRKLGVKPWHTEGTDSRRWVLLTTSTSSFTSSTPRQGTTIASRACGRMLPCTPRYDLASVGLLAPSSIRTPPLTSSRPFAGTRRRSLLPSPRRGGPKPPRGRRFAGRRVEATARVGEFVTVRIADDVLAGELSALAEGRGSSTPSPARRARLEVAKPRALGAEWSGRIDRVAEAWASLLVTIGVRVEMGFGDPRRPRGQPARRRRPRHHRPPPDRGGPDRGPRPPDGGGAAHVGPSSDPTLAKGDPASDAASVVGADLPGRLARLDSMVRYGSRAAIPISRSDDVGRVVAGRERPLVLRLLSAADTLAAAATSGDPSRPVREAGVVMRALAEYYPGFRVMTDDEELQRGRSVLAPGGGRDRACTSEVGGRRVPGSTSWRSRRNMSVLVVGSVAIDDVRTPDGHGADVLGGSASYFSLSARHFAPVSIVAVVGRTSRDSTSISSPPRGSGSTASTSGPARASIGRAPTARSSSRRPPTRRVSGCSSRSIPSSPTPSATPRSCFSPTSIPTSSSRSWIKSGIRGSSSWTR